MANRTNFYKNPSYTYNKHFNLNFALQNLRAYNIVTGNAPPSSDELLAASSTEDPESVRRKRYRETKQPSLRENEIAENDGPMSHQEYIEKRRKEISSSQPYEELSADVLLQKTAQEASSSVLNLVTYETDTSSSDCEDKQDCLDNSAQQSNNYEEKLYPSASGSTSEDRIKMQSEQRFPLPGEPVCVVCGKYGEYICNETEDDVCSMDCKAELLQKPKFQEGPLSGQIPVVSFSGDKYTAEVVEFGGDTWDYNRHCWSRKISSLCTYECWKCQRPGHLAEDCLVMTSNCQSSCSGEQCKQVAVVQSSSNSISRDLLELYKRCHQIAKNWSTAKCNICRLSTTLATCIKCSNTFCDSAGHLSEHIMTQPSHRQYYSYKLMRLVKCCKSTCKVTDIRDLLACHYCFNKAFDKFYDMCTATWKAAGLSIIWNSICCEDHFEWHRMNCPSADVEESAYIVRQHTRNTRHGQLSDFIF